jgi:hypothetical protein
MARAEPSCFSSKYSIILNIFSFPKKKSGRVDPLYIHMKKNNIRKFSTNFLEENFNDRYSKSDDVKPLNVGISNLNIYSRLMKIIRKCFVFFKTKRKTRLC